MAPPLHIRKVLKHGLPMPSDAVWLSEGTRWKTLHRVALPVGDGAVPPLQFPHELEGVDPTTFWVVVAEHGVHRRADLEVVPPVADMAKQQPHHRVAVEPLQESSTGVANELLVRNEWGSQHELMLVLGLPVAGETAGVKPAHKGHEDSNHEQDVCHGYLRFLGVLKH